MARNAQVTALNAHAGHFGQGIDVSSVMVAFATPRFAVENLFVKFAKSPPVAGDYVDVGVASGHAE